MSIKVKKITNQLKADATLNDVSNVIVLWKRKIVHVKIQKTNV